MLSFHRKRFYFIIIIFFFLHSVLLRRSVFIAVALINIERNRDGMFFSSLLNAWWPNDGLMARWPCESTSTTIDTIWGSSDQKRLYRFLIANLYSPLPIYLILFHISMSVLQLVCHEPWLSIVEKQWKQLQNWTMDRLRCDESNQTKTLLA